MPLRLYLMPIIGAGVKGDPRRAAHWDTFTSNGIDVEMKDMGNEPVCMVGANVPDSVHAVLIAFSDVVALPLNLDSQIGAQLTQVQNALEALNIPSGWVASGNTYRQVIRIVFAIFFFMQKLQGITPTRLMDTGITLNTRFNQLPQSMRTFLINTATALNFNTSSLSGTSTIRTILKAMADQLPQLEFIIGGVVI
jgi:hypothetical protein